MVTALTSTVDGDEAPSMVDGGVALCGSLLNAPRQPPIHGNNGVWSNQPCPLTNKLRNQTKIIPTILLQAGFSLHAFLLAISHFYSERKLRW